MSQYKLKNEKHEFLTGWDDPLRYMFLVVSDAETDEIVWSNLDQSNPAMTITQIEQKVREFGHELPLDIRDKLKKDGSI